MNILPIKPYAKQLSFDNDMMWIELNDGRKLGIPLVYFPPLLKATTDQLQNYQISGGGTGLHWDELDEDLQVENLLLDIFNNSAFIQSKAA
jgi:hypothetical protein